MVRANIVSNNAEMNPLMSDFTRVQLRFSRLRFFVRVDADGSDSSDGAAAAFSLT